MTPTDSITDEVRAVRRGVGLWLRDSHTFIRFTGKDVATWLQSQTTNDVVALQSGHGQANALCDRQGRLHAHFTLHRWDDEYWAVVERAQAPRLLEHLDAYLFIEDVLIEENGDEVDQLLVQGPRTLALLAGALRADADTANRFFPRDWEHVHPVELLGHEVLAIRHTETGEDGYLLIAERGEGEQLLQKLAAYDEYPKPVAVSPEAREVLRIEAGLPRFGFDISERDLLPETTLERTALSYNKGCFLGQEVIARLKTYGAPKRYLMGLVLESPIVQQALPVRGMGVSPMRPHPNIHAISEDPYGLVDIRRGPNLPHRTRDGANYFVTFRLHGSLPKSVRDADEKGFEAWDHVLDKNGDVFWLAKSEIASVVQDALLHFHELRYWLHAWSIMPNHVHVVVKPFPPHELSEIVHSWKSFSAHRANKLLGRKGKFWQSEYYDHLVRNADDLQRCIEYTINNPEKAGFIDWKYRGTHDIEYLYRGMAVSAMQHGRDAHATIGKIVVNGKKIGTLTSACHSPTLDAPIALASLDRDHRTPGTRLTAELRASGGEAVPVAARVEVLPLYEAPSRAERARTLYERALDLFQDDPDDTDPAAIPLLEEALLLDPDFEDAYEVLGVILHRHGRLPQAIRVMEQLAVRNPDCLMAHTNLSVFYVAQGDIERAEEEKAKAAVLQIQAASDDRAAHEAAQAERKRIEAEARERIGMFQEVLEIDPDDPVATFGLGKAYIQLGQHADAIPHLIRATEVQKDFSAAFLELGKCQQAIGQNPEAAATFHAGIAVAARKGDLMPLREMERRLKELEAVNAPT
jgi:folate-binding protein YgfZ